MIVITVKMDRELLTLLDRYAMNHGYYRSEVVRMAIIEFLATRGFKING